MECSRTDVNHAQLTFLDSFVDKVFLRLLCVLLRLLAPLPVLLAVQDVVGFGLVSLSALLLQKKQSDKLFRGRGTVFSREKIVRLLRHQGLEQEGPEKISELLC